MNVLQIMDPIITQQIMLRMYLNMSPKEYKKALESVIANGRKFTKIDDSTLSNSLSEDDCTSYADFTRTFLRNFRELERLPPTQDESAIVCSQVIAWWRVLSTFRTLHERPSPKKKIPKKSI